MEISIVLRSYLMFAGSYFFFAGGHFLVVTLNRFVRSISRQALWLRDGQHQLGLAVKVKGKVA
jgi:hypothetical protein